MFVQLPEEAVNRCLAWKSSDTQGTRKVVTLRVEPWQYTSLSLPDALLGAALGTTHGKTAVYSLRSQVVGDPNLFHKLLGFSRQSETHAVLCTLRQLLREYGEPVPENCATQAVQHLQHLFQTQPDSAPLLRDLASALNLSLSHLVRTFHAQVGLTPHEYLLHCRSDHARRHLRAGESVAQTALLCGFYDQSHLTGHFKRTFGMTPARYAAAAQLST